MKNSTKLLFVGLAIILAVLIVGAGYIYNKYHEMKSVYSSTLVRKEMNTLRDFNALHLEVSSDIELMQGDFQKFKWKEIHFRSPESSGRLVIQS